MNEIRFEQQKLFSFKSARRASKQSEIIKQVSLAAQADDLSESRALPWKCVECYNYSRFTYVNDVRTRRDARAECL